MGWYVHGTIPGGEDFAADDRDESGIVRGIAVVGSRGVGAEHPDDVCDSLQATKYETRKEHGCEVFLANGAGLQGLQLLGRLMKRTVGCLKAGSLALE
jgi:hypothetical protein